MTARGQAAVRVAIRRDDRDAEDAAAPDAALVAAAACRTVRCRTVTCRTVVSFAMAWLTLGCAGPLGGAPAYQGAVLDPASPKRDFTLATTDGRPFAFAAETRGAVTLLLFGYTHCPDICPTHMANIAAARRGLSPEDRARVRVVFVTTDPERDTPSALRAWLAQFDTAVVGLRGSLDDVHRVEALYGLAPSTHAMPMPGQGASSVTVGHATRVLAFTADDSLRVHYSADTGQQQWASDLPKLLAVAPVRSPRPNRVAF